MRRIEPVKGKPAISGCKRRPRERHGVLLRSGVRRQGFQVVIEDPGHGGEPGIGTAHALKGLGHSAGLALDKGARVFGSVLAIGERILLDRRPEAIRAILRSHLQALQLWRPYRLRALAQKGESRLDITFGLEVRLADKVDIECAQAFRLEQASLGGAAGGDNALAQRVARVGCELSG